MDDLSVVCPAGFQKSFDLHRECVLLLEGNRVYESKICGEPHLGRRGLVEEMDDLRAINPARKIIQDFLVCCDGSEDVIAIAEKIGIYAGDLVPVVDTLRKNGLIDCL